MCEHFSELSVVQVLIWMEMKRKVIICNISTSNVIVKIYNTLIITAIFKGQITVDRSIEKWK